MVKRITWRRWGHRYSKPSMRKRRTFKRGTRRPKRQMYFRLGRRG